MMVAALHGNPLPKDVVKCKQTGIAYVIGVPACAVLCDTQLDEAGEQV